MHWGLLIEQRQPLHIQPEINSVPVKSCLTDLNAKDLLFTDHPQDMNSIHEASQGKKWHHSKLEAQVHLFSLDLFELTFPRRDYN